VTERAGTMPEQARGLTITDSVTYARACEFLKAVKGLRQEIAETFDPHINRAFVAHRALCAEKKSAETPLADAERIVKDAMTAWDREQDQIRRAEQARLEAAARRHEEDARLMEAEAIAAAGDHEMADALLDAPLVVPTVAVAPLTPKVSGISFRETWSARLDNLLALVKFVAANPTHLGLLQANGPALNAQARSLKGQMRIPGVTPLCTRDVAASARR
jgi:hypothetical protein